MHVTERNWIVYTGMLAAQFVPAVMGIVTAASSSTVAISVPVACTTGTAMLNKTVLVNPVEDLLAGSTHQFRQLYMFHSHQGAL